MIIRIHDTFSDYHQNGNNTVVRVGNKSSDISKAGVFHLTTATERTPGSHGAGTAYCGRVFYCLWNGSHGGYHYISTGIGEYAFVESYSSVESECRAYKQGIDDCAYCFYERTSEQCPLGWGNQPDYAAFKPGCYYGTYYPNPTPALNTDIFTGSHTTFIVSTETLIELSSS